MKKTSKYIAYLLRHNPSAAELPMDENGWVEVRMLIEGVCKTGRQLDIETLTEIVETDEKQRFSFNEDGSKIRANQGHSLRVDVEMKELAPPAVLYHGTAEKYLASIREKGILKQTRNYVHLSKNPETAQRVGKRHGTSVVLQVDAQKMHKDGYRFFLSANGVWQIEHVPYCYVTEEIR